MKHKSEISDLAANVFINVLIMYTFVYDRNIYIYIENGAQFRCILLRNYQILYQILTGDINIKNSKVI